MRVRLPLWLDVAPRRRYRLRRVATTLTALGLAYLGAAAWLDARGRRPPPAGSFDAIVVLGCRVRADGVASPSLARRAALAAALYHEDRAPRVVLTGGVGTHPPSEAQAAASVARAAGVPRGALVLEDRSTSTEENAREAARHLGRDARVLLVTDAYHVLRAERVFARYFREARGVGALGPASQRARGALREVGALAAYALLGRLAAAPRDARG